MLQIRHLTITHLKDFKNMVSDLSLTVNTGDKIAIIGEEGNGKSTLLKLLMNDALVSDYVSYTGEIQKSYNRYAYLPQSLPKNERKLSLNDYFFGGVEVELDYNKLYRFAQEFHFESERFICQIIGNYLLKPQCCLYTIVPSAARSSCRSVIGSPFD